MIICLVAVDLETINFPKLCREILHLRSAQKPEINYFRAFTVFFFYLFFLFYKRAFNLRSIFVATLTRNLINSKRTKRSSLD